MTSKLAGPGTFFRLPFIGGDLAKPLTTDLSAGQLMQLGWVKFRANDSRALHCRLGGERASLGGQSVLIGGEENTAAISMFTGRSAPQPPPPGTTFGAGCRSAGQATSRRRRPSSRRPCPDFFSDEPESLLPSPSFGGSVFLRPPCP